MWKKTISIAAAALCCSLLYCDNPTDEALKWRSAMDFPMNLTLKAERNAETSYPISEDGSVILDMADSSFTIYDQMLLFREKMDTVSADYNISIVNGYDFDLVFYALFAPFESGVWGERMGLWNVEDVYGFIKANAGAPDMILKKDEYVDSCVNLLGSTGLEVKANSTKSTGDIKDTPLCGLLLNAPSVAWRWMAKISQNNYDTLSEASASSNDTGKISARFRVRIKGVANLESLMAF
jgi:hypothetical protein